MSACAHEKPWIDPETNLAYCLSCLLPADRADESLGELPSAPIDGALTEADLHAFVQAMGLENSE